MGQPIRVLHLEDSDRDAEAIRVHLNVPEIRSNIVLAKTRAEFEAALSTGTFDLIISDYSLPGYDGVAALKHAQAMQPEVPVIVVSGTVDEGEGVRCLQLGATDYLLKGRLERLVPAVTRALAEAEARRGRRQVDEQLNESQSRKAAVLDSVLDCIITVNANGVVLEFNAAAERTFGYTKAQAIGRALADLIIPVQFRKSYDAALSGLAAGADSSLLGRLIQLTAMRADGAEIPVEVAITAVGAGAAAVFTGVLRDITARQLAEATRGRLAAIVDASDDAIFSMSLDHTILTWNAGAERLFGYRAAEIVGGTRASLIPDDKNAEFAAMTARAARGEAGTPVDTQRVCLDGSVVDISLVMSPMTDSSGRVDSVSMIARDIGSKIRDKAVLRSERDRAQEYLDTAEVILLKLDLQGNVALVNRYACSVLGWTASELLGQDWIDKCVPVRERARMRSKLNELVSAGVSVVENPILTKSGEERLFEWRNTTLRDAQGEASGTFSCGTDVTERSLAAEALRQAEERMRFALQGADVGIWDMDCQTSVVRWSEVLEAQYGLEHGVFDGTFASFAGRVYSEDRAEMLESIERAMKSGGDFATLHRVVYPDGSVHRLTGAGRVYLGDDGQPVRAVGISMDITARHALEEQYQQAQKMEAVGRLAAGVAHDFNNLLTVILGFCGLVQSGLEPDDPRAADLDEIKNAGGRAADLTRQLLAFSRKEIIQPTLLDLNTVVKDIRGMLARLIGEDVAIVLDLAPVTACIRADRGQIEQVVVNLAVNARDAMPNGGTLTIGTAMVELHGDTRLAIKEGPAVALTVTDTGLGMTADVKARLFEPFFTTKGVGKGTGLGLATVHGVVTRSGGRIVVNSEIGRGTTFQVSFPQAESGPATAAVVPPVVLQPRARTVLVVEDEAALRQLTKRLLERMGHTVLVAPCADEALVLFRENPAIDLLLTDVVMPGASGPALVVQLIEQRPGLKVIYMSGYTDDAIVHHGVLDPGIAFLHKPFSANALEGIIREVVEQAAVA